MEKVIVFFDGECNLCNGAVDFLISRDTNSNLMFASLQGEAAKKYISQVQIDRLQSLIVWSKGQLYRESDAVLFLLKELGGFWRLVASIGHVFPRNFRDVIYRWIARHRYIWFGKRATCRVPNKAERAKFID